MRLFPAVAVAVASLLTAMGLAVTSCMPEPEPCPTDPVPGLAVAVGNRANSPEPAWPGELDAEVSAIISATEKGAENRGVTLVRADGSPTIACVLTYDASARNEPAKEHNRETFTDSVTREVAAVRAVAPEANPLAALSRAGAAAGPDGTVVLIDSGLQTVAPLDFRANDLLDKSIDRIVAALAETGVLPDLHGRRVVLVGIGYTAPPQPALGEHQRARLIELWQKIATAAGAREVVSVLAPNDKPSVAGLPDVGEVPVPPPGDLPLACDATVVLPDDGDVGFRPESVAFRDETRARAVLATVAAWLKENPTATGTVLGSIAHYGQDQGNGGLSLDRATRVRQVLVELGAGARQLIAAGTGWGPFPTKTAPPDTVSDRRNRRVVVELTCAEEPS